MKSGFENLPELTAKHNEIHRRAFADYEEGDWTAGFTCGTSGTITISSSSKTGAYVKVGKMVTVTGRFVVDSVSSPVGILSLTGLPFTCGNDDKYYSGATIYTNALEATAATSMIGYVDKNNTRIVIGHFAAGVSGQAAADVKANSQFIISATYFTD